MVFLESSTAKEELPFSAGLPEDYKGPYIDGSVQGFFHTENACIVKQELNYNDVRLQFFSIVCSKKTVLTCSLLKAFQSLFAYEGELTINWNRKDALTLKKQQFMLLHGESHELLTIELKKKGLFQFVHALYGPAFITELLPGFPDMEAFLTGGEGRTKPELAEGPVKDVLKHILFAIYEPFRLPFYFKNKIEEYMFLVLEQSTRPRSIPKATEMEKQALYKVRDMILSDMLKHHSIKDLAKKNKINVTRLKILFKQEFGMGPYGFLLNARLEKIKELIEGGLPMKVAAPLAGYSTTSFSSAFKKKYGSTPMTMLRKYKK